MVILGIDPGIKRIGYGLIEKSKGELCLLQAGILKISASKSHAQNIKEVKRETSSLITKFKPKILTIEKLFFYKNQKTALQVAEARGIIILAASEKKIEIKELTPNEIKLGVTGSGSADKKAVAKMVRLILKEPNLKAIDDATDALAIAIAGSNKKPY